MTRSGSMRAASLATNHDPARAFFRREIADDTAPVSFLPDSMGALRRAVARRHQAAGAVPLPPPVTATRAASVSSTSRRRLVPVRFTHHSTIGEATQIDEYVP